MTMIIIIVIKNNYKGVRHSFVDNFNSFFSKATHKTTYKHCYIKQRVLQAQVNNST